MMKGGHGSTKHNRKSLIGVHSTMHLMQSDLANTSASGQTDRRPRIHTWHCSYTDTHNIHTCTRTYIQLYIIVSAHVRTHIHTPIRSLYSLQASILSACRHEIAAVGLSGSHLWAEASYRTNPLHRSALWNSFNN